MGRETSAKAKSGWPRKGPPSKEYMKNTMLDDLKKYVISWAETPTDEECSALEGASVDGAIMRARKLCKKYEFKFCNPADEAEEDNEGDEV